MKESFLIERESQFAEVVSAIRQMMKATNEQIVLLYGAMGAGKTTLVKHWLDPDGQGVVSSPTFSIVNEYLDEGEPFYHFDLYRIEGPEELLEIGFEEYLDSGYPCCIEWPERAGHLLDLPHIRVEISVEGEQRRCTIEERKGVS